MCLDDDQILRLFEGMLSESEGAAVAAHLGSCKACRALVAAAAPAHTRRGAGATLSQAVPPEASVLQAAATHDTPAGVLGRGASIGRYLLLSLLGKGGMGSVYAAYDAELDRRVALKLLHTASGSEGARRLLQREARALGKLSHPNVVQVYDAGEHEGDVFVAMELVEGHSLDAWCTRAPKPDWQEVLGAYLDAARGLSGAHAKGIVHRDVKPSNILRGHDGRVRVADFGLAASRDAERKGSASDPAPDAAAASFLGPLMPVPPDAALGRSLTATGAVLGTPLYMAPEQQEGLRATAASDQYSFCVALYEALFGALPFTYARGVSINEVLANILAAKKAGPPASPPANSPVPAWIHKALVRGLSLDPGLRHPSMDALIAALSDDPDARRRARRRRAGAAAAAVVLFTVAAIGWTKNGVFHDPCAHPERQLAGVWDAGIEGRVRAAFLATGRAYAAGTATRVLALLDRYGADWASMRAEVCRAARGDERRREILGLRDACLDRRRGQLQALAALFAEKPAPEVLDKAVQAAAALSPIAYCADIEALTARVRPPEDPGLRARVAELQPRVDRLEALHRAGRYNDGLALGEPLLAETATLPYAPLRAQVEYWMGQVCDGTGDYERASALLQEAAVSAAEGRDDVLAANAWAALLVEVGDQQRRFEQANVIRALGRTAMARVPDDLAQATWSSAEGAVLVRAGKLAEAKVAVERALSLREKALGADHPLVAGSLANLAIVLCAMGDCSAGRAPIERALAISERSLGPDHPETAIRLTVLGNVLHRVGEYAQSLSAHERARAIMETSLGPEHPLVASSLNNAGNVLYDRGDYPQALSLLERALAIKEKALGPDHPYVAGALVSVGRTRVRLGQLEAALPLLQRALAVREKRQSPEVVDALLGLGELYLARRMPEEAIPLLQRALALDNAEYQPEVQLTLADALWQLGHERARARSLTEQARATYEHLGHAPGLDRATRWLAEHPLG